MARDKRWVVRSGEGPTLGHILAKMNEPPRAIDEGRVFVGRRRAGRSAEPVREGDEVRVSQAPAGPQARGGKGGPLDAALEPAPLAVLFEGDGLVVCDKPAGLPTVPDHASVVHSLVGLVAARARLPVSAVRVTSRLDREVSGVVVFALDEDAEARLRDARAEGVYARRYVAIASTSRAHLATQGRGAVAAAKALADASRLGAPAVKEERTLPDDGTWDAPIGEGRDPRHRAVNGPNAKAATTRFRVVARADDAALLAVDPQTGRTHQIRVHASHALAPLFGDGDYDGPTRLTSRTGAVIATRRIALHAARVTVPSRSGVRSFEAPIPAALVELWRSLSGADDAWLRALTVDS